MLHKLQITFKRQLNWLNKEDAARFSTMCTSIKVGLGRRAQRLPRSSLYPTRTPWSDASGLHFQNLAKLLRQYWVRIEME
jgi:hypothetical protein